MFREYLTQLTRTSLRKELAVGEELYHNLEHAKQALTAYHMVNLLAHEYRYHCARFVARQQNAFQAALQSASQLVRPSLLDFLR